MSTGLPSIKYPVRLAEKTKRERKTIGAKNAPLFPIFNLDMVKKNSPIPTMYKVVKRESIKAVFCIFPTQTL